MAPSQGVPVDDLRGIREHADASPVLLDLSGARARKLGRAGRVVGSTLTAWLVALVFAGLGLIPANLIPFGAFVQNNLIPQALISSDDRDGGTKQDAGAGPTMRASADWYEPATAGTSAKRPGDLLERRVERRAEGPDRSGATDPRRRAAGATAPTAPEGTAPSAATTQPVSAPGGNGAAPAPTANSSAPSQAADHPVGNSEPAPGAPSSDSAGPASAPASPSGKTANGNGATNSNAAVNGNGAAHSNAAAGSHPAGNNGSNAANNGVAASASSGAAPDKTASPTADADASASSPGRPGSTPPGQAKKSDAGSQGE